jgi:hypothetical protein
MRLHPLAELELIFLGTGYRPQGNPKLVEPEAEKCGIISQVVEIPDRIPLLDTQVSLESADALLIVGSDDLSYQPSKLYQYLFLDKPVVCVAPSGSRLASAVEGLEESVFFLASDVQRDASSARDVARGLARFLARPVVVERRRRQLSEQYEARLLAARECALFDRVVQEG